MRIFVYRWHLGRVIPSGLPLATSDFDLPVRNQQIEIGGNQMTMINLREYYPDSYTTDCFIAVPDEIAETLRHFKLEDEAYRIRTYRNKAYFSLDYGENIEREAALPSMSPDESYIAKIEKMLLYSALQQLPATQQRRIYAHFILGMTKAEIARAEGVHKSRITRSINAGIKELGKFLKDFF